MEELRLDHAARGKRSYVIPGGGSNALGTLGYVACAREIMDDAFRQGLRFDSVVCASGSGGTHAGLVAGFFPEGGPDVLGVSIRANSEDQGERVYELAGETLRMLAVSASLPRSAVRVVDGYVGGGYSIPTDGMIEAVHLLARLEGILLDPIYTGKAMAGLIDLARSGQLARSGNVLFVHTGGWPALFAYEDVLDEHR
jgi:D-cysteine desulfhydrase